MTDERTPEDADVDVEVVIGEIIVSPTGDVVIGVPTAIAAGSAPIPDGKE